MGANQSQTESSGVMQKGGNSREDESKSAAERRFLKNFPSGFMTKQQFISFYKMMHMSNLSDEECGNLFHIADFNHDGNVTFDEYQLFCDILASGSVEDRMRLTFQLYDKDCSKGITRAEIVHMLKNLYKSKGWHDVDQRAEKNADQILRAVDGNSDGILTEDEFVRGISSRDDLVCLIFGNE